MKNYIKTLEFKQKSAQYHYDQAIDAIENIEGFDGIHRGTSEFCAMMEVVNNCIHIAIACAEKQSKVETKAFMKSLDNFLKDELTYIDQFVKANRMGHVFEILDSKIVIQSIPMGNKNGEYPEKQLYSYLKEVKMVTDQIIARFMDIYKGSSAHYDQSWRTVDMYRSSFSCHTCGTLVTKMLSHIGNLSDISLKEKERFVPRLKYVYGHEVIRADLLPWGGVNEVTANEVLIPLDSLYFGVKKTPAPGCCGPDSSDFNVFCSKGHPIGKEAADCWMPHFIRLPLDKVKKNKIV